MSSRPKYYNSHASATIPPFLVQHEESDDEPLYEEPLSFVKTPAKPARRSNNVAVHSGEIQFSTPIQNDGIGLSPIEKGEETTSFAIEINNEISFGHPGVREPPIHSPSPSHNSFHKSSQVDPSRQFKISPNKISTAHTSSYKHVHTPVHNQNHLGIPQHHLSHELEANRGREIHKENKIEAKLTPNRTDFMQMREQSQLPQSMSPELSKNHETESLSGVSITPVQNLTHQKMEREQLERNRKLQELQERRKQMMNEDTDSKLQSELERIIQRRRERTGTNKSSSLTTNGSPFPQSTPEPNPNLSNTPNTLVPSSDTHSVVKSESPESIRDNPASTILINYQPFKHHSEYEQMPSITRMNYQPEEMLDSLGNNTRDKQWSVPKTENFDIIEDMEISMFLQNISPVKVDTAARVDSRPSISIPMRQVRVSETFKRSPTIRNNSSNFGNDEVSNNMNHGNSSCSFENSRRFNPHQLEKENVQTDELTLHNDSWRITDYRAEQYQAHHYISKETQEILSERRVPMEEETETDDQSEAIILPLRESRYSLRAPSPSPNVHTSKSFIRSSSSPGLLQQRESDIESAGNRESIQTGSLYALRTVSNGGYQPLSPLDQRFGNVSMNFRKPNTPEDREAPISNTVASSNTKSLHYISKQRLRIYESGSEGGSREGMRIELNGNFIQSIKKVEMLARAAKNEEDILRIVAKGENLWKCTPNGYMNKSHQRFFFVDRINLTLAWCTTSTKKTTSATTPGSSRTISLKDIETITCVEMPTGLAMKRFGLKRPRNAGKTVYGLVLETPKRVIEIIMDTDVFTACNWLVGLGVAAQKSKDLLRQQ